MKTARPSTAPRKLPRQERSRATVDAITQAATYILVKSGWERLTTNAVAERAGVNISSLYQYFPNKQAIVAELQRRHVTQTRRKLTQALAQMPEQRSLHEALVLLVCAMVDEHRAAPSVHRAIEEELPSSMRCATPDYAEQLDDLRQGLERFMENVPHPAVAIQVGVVAAHAVIHAAAAERPAVLLRADFVDEVVALLEGYLRRPAPARRRVAPARKTGRAS
jgi:AcrR family transcriptional regulator